MAENQTLARPYAKAAFDFARGEKVLDSWSAALALAAAIVRDRDFVTYVSRPEVSSELQADKLLQAMGHDATNEQVNFLRLVTNNSRIALLPAIAQQFEIYKSSNLNQIDVVVESAFKLTAAQSKTLGAKLGQRFNAEINMSSVVNPDLIAGVVIRTGNEVIDDSARGKLEKLRISLLA